jgi:DNA-binding SARP family transcriptional activator/tetratricopeptide (TPR) repeat protein/TolB-like protein
MPRLKLFGSPVIEGEESPVTGPASQRHRVALLALLAVSHPGGSTRDKLAALLWPERGTHHARSLLKQAVHVLRRALGPNAIVSAGDGLRLGVEAVPCDVVDFERASASGDPMEAVLHYSGPFLDGFFLDGATEFERLVEGERQRLAGLYGRALRSLAESADTEGNPARAAEWWRALAALDPYDASTAVALMRALVASGNPASAIRHAEVHQALLQEDFGMSPPPEVMALAGRLRKETPRADLADAVQGDAHTGAPSTLPPRLATVHPTVRPVALVATGPGPAWPPDDALPRRVWRARLPPFALPAGAVALAGLAAWLLLPGTGTRSLDERRVVVAPFENHTGEAAMDPIGVMVADRIAQGISHAAIAEVVPTHTALAAARRVQAATPGQPGPDPIRALAEETGAGLVISGGYYRSGDSLRFHAHITHARRGRLLHALAPVEGPVSAPVQVVEQVRQRTTGALALLVDHEEAAPGRFAGGAPTYEAYQAFADAMVKYVESRWAEAAVDLQRAASLDPAYLPIRLLLATAHANAGHHAEAESLLRELDRERERLAPFQRAQLDILASWFLDDPAARYDAAKRAAELAPGSLPHVQWGIEAIRRNRPHEGLRILSDVDPTRGEIRGWSHYWHYLTEAHHMLGRHRRELRHARRAQALYPDDPLHLLLEARAWAALGRPAAAAAAVEARLSLSPQRRPEPGPMMIHVGHELRAHGHADASTAMYRRAVEWYRGQTDGDATAPLAGLAFAHLYAGDWDAAQAILERLTLEEPDDYDHVGALGLIAALRGDHEGAEQAIASLTRDVESPLWSRRAYGARTSRTYWHACIAAQLDRHAEAVALLRQAFNQAVWQDLLPHADPCLEPLRDFPPFRKLMRPSPRS